MPETMTIGEWRNANYFMHWGIYDQASWEEFDAVDNVSEQEWKDAYNRVKLDFTAPEGAPDGTHKVYVAHYDHPPRYGLNAVIRDGMFVPEPTDGAVLEAACNTFGANILDVRRTRKGMEKRFIEAFAWGERRGALRVQLGS